MRVSTKVLAPVLLLDDNIIKVEFPEFYEWMLKNKRHVGMHMKKFKLRLHNIFNAVDKSFDLTTSKVRRSP
jgi:hypothetical protein